MPDGVYNMKFRLYTVGSGGSSVWSEDRLVSASQGVQLTNGLFSVRLGDVTSLPASLFASGSLYLEVELPTPATATSASPSWTEGAMTPRNQLATSAYAYNSETLDGFDSADFGKLVANNTWTGNNAFNGAFDVSHPTGTVTIAADEIVLDGGANGVNILADTGLVGNLFMQGDTAQFKSTTSNATAFRIQNSSNADLFVVDTANTQVEIGSATADATGVALVLDTKNTAGDPTGVDGAMYYNSNAGKFRCYQAGAWRDCTSSLQDGYNLSVGGTTPEIKLDSTRGGIDIQDADTTTGGSLLNIRASNGSGLGSALFSVGNTGAVTAQNSADSTAAFTISRAGSGGSLLVADTTNSRVQIGGATADATGVVLVLDTKNSAGDPTGVDGAMYYSTDMKSFRCYQNGVWRSCLGGLAYANTTPSNAINSTNADTPFSTKHTIPAGSCQNGRVYRVTARGVYSTYNAGLGNPGNIILRVKLGGTIVGETAASANFGNSLSNQGWRIDFNITCASYSTNEVEGQGLATISTTPSAMQTLAMTNAATKVVSSLASAQDIEVTADWGTANIGNTITLRQLVVEELGP